MARECAGIPFSGTRTITDEERAWLTDRERSLRRRRIAFGCGTALVPILLFLPLMLSFLGDAAAIGMIPALWLCLYLPLKWWDARKRSAVARASAQAQEADVFEGIPDTGALAEASLFALQTVGLELDGETTQRLDRIRSSGEVIAVNGHRPPSPIWADETEVALPEQPSAEFPAFVPQLAMDNLDLPHRALSPAEMTELRRLMPACESIRQQGCLLAFTIYFFVGSILGASNDDPPSLRKYLAAVRLIAGLYLAWRLFLATRERVRHGRDVRGATVVRVEGDGALLEVLPHLGLVWTVDGHPTPWRHAAQSKPRPPS